MRRGPEGGMAGRPPASRLVAGAPLQGGLTPAAAGNALLAGGALVVSFHRHERAALGRDGAGARGWRRWL